MSRLRVALENRLLCKLTELTKARSLPLLPLLSALSVARVGVLQNARSLATSSRLVTPVVTRFVAARSSAHQRAGRDPRRERRHAHP
jgi:hypothetical protein